MGWCWPLFVCRSLHAYSSASCTEKMKQGHQWEAATCWDQVYTCCSTLPPSHSSLLSWSFLLSNPAYWSPCLLQPGDSFHFHYSTWCQRRMTAEHRNGPICLYDLYQSQVLSCISLATRRSCRWTQMIIHQKKVYSLKYLSRQWCGWWLRWELWCDLWGGSLFPLFELPLWKIMNKVLLQAKTEGQQTDLSVFKYY